MGWRLSEGGAPVSSIEAPPLSMELYPSGFWRERVYPWLRSSDWYRDFDWFLYFNDGKTKFLLGGGYVPKGLDLAEARRAAVAGAAEFLNGFGAKLAAAAADEGGV